MFRRQLSTVETDPAEPTTPLIEPEDDYDDIDKVRDDLQSTKQLLEIELKNRRKIDEENAKLQSEIRRLKEELGNKSSAPAVAAPAARRSSSTNKMADASMLKKSTSRMAIKKPIKKDSSDEDDSNEEEDFGELDAVEEELNTLRGQAELARKSAEEFEMRYKETSNKLVTTQAEMEDLEMKVTVLQKKLRRAQGGGVVEETQTCDAGVQTDPMEPPPSTECRRSHSKRDLRKQMSRQDSRGSNQSSANQAVGEEASEEEEEEDEEEDEDARYLKTQKRELALLASRLRSTKDKEKNVRNERVALYLQLKKFRNDLKDEKKKSVDTIIC